MKALPGRWRHTVFTLVLMLVALVAHCASEIRSSDEVLAPVLAVSYATSSTGDSPSEEASHIRAPSAPGTSSLTSSTEPLVLAGDGTPRDLPDGQPGNRSSCPDNGVPLHEDSAAPPTRVIGGPESLTPALTVAAWAGCPSRQSDGSSAVPSAPGDASGTALCTELCVSRR
ncbi:hypothetical protein ACL02T_10105 [Pseudonocardia sp. RS010]|uniref:hypothetical protein n=1 Tax=Pseudonocardia sp. RS010 TaxID=3385979 RepID=UPI0039A0090A